MQVQHPIGFARAVRATALFVTSLLPLIGENRISLSDWSAAVLQAQTQLKNAQFADAVESGKRSLRIAREGGAADSRVANSYYLLGLIYHDWAHCAESRANYAMAIGVLRRQANPDLQNIFNAETTLISGLCDCGEFIAAGKAFRTYQQELVNSANDLASQTRLLSLEAALSFGRKNYARAENQYLKAIAAMENTPGATPLDLAMARGTLASVFDKEGRYRESLAQLEPVIAFFERYAPRHPSLVADLNNAGCILAKMGRHQESERYFRRALGMAEDLYGEDNWVSAGIMRSYAWVLRANKQPQLAAEWQKRSTDATRRSGSAHIETIGVEDLRAIR